MSRKFSGVLLALLAIPAALAQATPEVPPALAKPGDTPIVTIAAYGVQIYECKASSAGPLEWTFKEPRADLLIDGAPAGKHGAGPFWEHKDGSKVIGKVAARADGGPGNVPLLRLDIASSSGTGLLADAGAILRLTTRGGTLAGSCPTAGRLFEVPYTADYVVLKK